MNVSNQSCMLSMSVVEDVQRRPRLYFDRKPRALQHWPALGEDLNKISVHRTYVNLPRDLLVFFLFFFFIYSFDLFPATKSIRETLTYSIQNIQKVQFVRSKSAVRH